jgi:hypothetical protein
VPAVLMAQSHTSRTLPARLEEALICKEARLLNELLTLLIRLCTIEIATLGGRSKSVARDDKGATSDLLCG